ncbi:MAG: hypothetical protein ABL982_14255 [Vicinamibacterales bacterium]
MPKQTKTRRDMLTGLGAIAAAGALGTRTVAAQSTPPAAFVPAMHAEDAWMSAMPGKHRIVLDVTSVERVPDAIRFAGNLLNGHKSGYGLDDSDLGIVVCFRHAATPYGYDNAFWAKSGKIIDAEADPVPTGNPYDSGGRTQLTDLTKRGVHFMVCGVASRGLAGRIAGQGGDADAVLKDMTAHLIPNARIVPAGVIGVTHAQERGFSLLYVG